MCKTFNPCKYITNECINYEIIINFVKTTYNVFLEPKYAKTIITQSKGCVKCFFTRLTKHICNELNKGEYMMLYKKSFIESVLKLYYRYLKYLSSIDIISEDEIKPIYYQFAENLL